MDDEAAITDTTNIISEIIDQYAVYWPLTEKQIYYLLLKEGRLGTELVDLEQLYGIASIYPCPVDPDGLINCSPSLHGSFLPYASLRDRKKGYRRCVMYHLSAVPDFEIWRDQENHVELWVNDPAITDFLRINRIEGEMHVPIHDCSRLLGLGPLTEARARLHYMRAVEGKSRVVLYLANLDYSGRERLKHMQTHFSGCVDQFDRIGINTEHTEDLPPKSGIGCDDDELKNDRVFLEESILRECHSLHAVEPPELFHMVKTGIERYYDMNKYPHERIALWQKAHEGLKQSLEAVFDDLLDLTG